jgi:hypothetical protein
MSASTWWHDFCSNAWSDPFFNRDIPAGPLPAQPQLVLDTWSPIAPKPDVPPIPKPALIVTALPPVPTPAGVAALASVPPAGAAATIVPATAAPSPVPLIIGLAVALAVLR